MTEKKKITLELIKEFLTYVLFFIAVIVISLAVRKYALYPVEVVGSSMETTLQEGDRFYVNRLVDVEKLNRYDIVVFRAFSEDNPLTNEDESHSLLVKRIIGLPGELICVREDGTILVEGADKVTYKLKDGYCLSTMYHGINWDVTDDNVFETVRLGDDEYFVLGDNRAVSLDSRDSRIKGVHFDSILGKYGFKKLKLFGKKQ